MDRNFGWGQYQPRINNEDQMIEFFIRVLERDDEMQKQYLRDVQSLVASELRVTRGDPSQKIYVAIHADTHAILIDLFKAVALEHYGLLRPPEYPIDCDPLPVRELDYTKLCEILNIDNQ